MPGVRSLALVAICDLASSPSHAERAVNGWIQADQLLDIWGLDRPRRVAVLVGACAAVSHGFHDLGDAVGGAPPAYGPRGWLQHKGLATYERLAQIFAVRLVGSPELLANPKVAWAAAATQMRCKALGQRVEFLADQGNFDAALGAIVPDRHHAHAVALTRRALELIEGTRHEPDPRR